MNIFKALRLQFKALRLQREEDRQPGSLSDSLANYEGSPKYKAMLERNGGVAPGGPAESGRTRIGPRGGKYTVAKTKGGRTYRRYF
jgi:hypothetical protein